VTARAALTTQIPFAEGRFHRIPVDQLFHYGAGRTLMSRFGSPDEIGKAFVAAYFSSVVHNDLNIPKFYAPDAVLRRGSVTFSFQPGIDVNRIVPSLPIPSVLTITRYATLPSPGGTILVAVGGVIEVENTRTGFSHNFVLIERNDKIWIQADFLTVADEKLFAHGDSDTFFLIEGEDEPVRPRLPRRAEGPTGDAPPDEDPAQVPPAPKDRPPRRGGRRPRAPPG
jgi:hypothetical protein